MPTDVIMPQMGESIFEGTITKWLKKIGEHVEKDEPLFEISTDKVDAEIPSPEAGILSEIRSREGETVQVNTIVAVIGGTITAASATAPAAAPPQANATPAAESVPATADQIPAAPIPAAQIIDPHRRIRSSPLVRRIAREKSVDLHRVPGSGTEGRITKEDILQFLANPQAASTVSAQATPQLAGQVVPLSKMRSIIADRMLESVRISPHAHTVYKIDMTRIARIREREKSSFERHHGVKLTYMPFIASAVIETLRKFPIVNASLIDNSIHYHANIHLGIAVALEWGLIVPTVIQAESRSFSALAKSIADLADRARTKKLKPEEVGGSTFTLTNSGVFGGEFGTPILNQPESAILAIGGLKKEPVVLTDAEGNDTIAIRSMQYFCLGFDHRTIDGADAGKFMRELKCALEEWNKELK